MAIYFKINQSKNGESLFLYKNERDKLGFQGLTCKAFPSDVRY